MTPPISVFDYERLAATQLHTPTLDYYRSGAHDEHTLAENQRAFTRVALHYRVMVDVSRRDLSTTLLGQPLDVPILVAPTAFHRLATPQGERATVRAAGAVGTAMVLSTLSNTAVEDVRAEATTPTWFQLYVYKDRGATEALVRRVEAAGCSALVLTVDAPLLGVRERDVRNGFSLPPGLSVENMLPAGLGALPEQQLTSGLAAYFADLLEPALTWSLLDWLASLTSLPVLVKGLVRPDDARAAFDHGAAGVVVSNHGGRQLDTSPATFDVLPAIAAEVKGRGVVLIDGGIRRGTDVLKALAAGADAVLVGRPVLWGLAVDGEAGARHVLEILRRELDLAMALCGCPTIADITPDLLPPSHRPAR